MDESERFKIVRTPAQVLLAPDGTMFEVRRIRRDDPTDPRSGEVVADGLSFDEALSEQAKLGADYDALIAALLAFEDGGLARFRVIPMQ